MSAEAMAWAFGVEEISPAAKLLLVICADNYSGQWGPTNMALALAEQRFGGTDDDFDAAIAELKDNGYVVVRAEWVYLQFRSAVQEISVLTESPAWTAVSKAVRQRIYERDGFACIYCTSTTQLSIDHVLPRSRGGTNNEDNLATACRRCNSSKGSRTLKEWRRNEL